MGFSISRIAATLKKLERIGRLEFNSVVRAILVTQNVEKGQKMKKTLLTIAAATTALFSVAGAPAAHAEYAKDDKNFEGVKIGVQAGWERRQVNEALLPAPNDIRLTDKTSGIIYGGFIGYDAQFDQIVVGVEADFNLNGKTLRSTFGPQASPGPGALIELDSKWAASVSARAGVAVTPELLAYGRVGYNLNRYTVRGFTAGNSTPVATAKATGDGFLFGGGLEYAINRNASFRLEYRRINQESTLGSNQVLGGLTFRF